jgi:hypothetical protein
MEARLKSGIWVKALIRRCDLAAIAVAVAARGDEDAGAILLKFNGRDAGCFVLAQARGRDGELLWMRATGPAPVTEADADTYIERQRRRDPDLWVVEIESGSAATVIDGRIA